SGRFSVERNERDKHGYLCKKHRLGDAAALDYVQVSGPSPKWSPDGRTIAFLRGVPRPGPKSALLAIPPLGGAQRKRAAFVGHGRGRALDWSPDGKWLVTGGDFENKGSDRIYLVSVESGDFRPLTAPLGGMGDSDPAISPDGSALAFVRWWDL